MNTSIHNITKEIEEMLLEAIQENFGTREGEYGESCLDFFPDRESFDKASPEERLNEVMEGEADEREQANWGAGYCRALEEVVKLLKRKGE